MMQAISNPRDEAIVRELMQRRHKRREVLTGDYIRSADGSYDRIAYVWPDRVQIEWGTGSYHMLASGNCSMSGGLEPKTIPLAELQSTEAMREGSAWIFHGNRAGAGLGRDFKAKFRVWVRR